MNVITVRKAWHTRVLLTIRPGTQRPTDGDFFVLAPTELSDPATPLARILGIGLARRDAIRHAGRRPSRLAPWLAATILIASASHLMRAIGIPLWDALTVALTVTLVLALALALLSIWSVDSLLLRLALAARGEYAMQQRRTPDAVPHRGRPDASGTRPSSVRQVSAADQPLLPRVANELAHDPGQSDTALARAVFGPGKDSGRSVQRVRRMRALVAEE
jgi:hypothetical protein